MHPGCTPSTLDLVADLFLTPPALLCEISYCKINVDFFDIIFYICFPVCIFLGNKCFQINILNEESGVSYWDARDICRRQSGIRPELASFDNELENGMNLSDINLVYNCYK